MIKNTIPDIIISRLPLYLRTLELLQRQGETKTSSQQLGDLLNISAAQIRKDLSQFGEFGKQGTGYSIAYLSDQISRILNLTHRWEMILVGVGDIGSALARYQGFANSGFKLIAAFDADDKKVGKKVGATKISSMADLIPTIKELDIKIAMLSVPASEAQAVADQLVEAGIESILNYAPTHLQVPPYVKVSYVDPLSNLQHMAYYLE